MNPAAVEAAYAVLDHYGLVHHFNCDAGDDACLQRRHEREKVAEVVLAAFAQAPAADFEPLTDEERERIGAKVEAGLGFGAFTRAIRGRFA